MSDERLTNLARRKEIGEEVLRQRRDLYVVSVGLLIFYLAEGEVLDQWTMTFIPARVHAPQVFLWAAWAGFLFFLFRYWLVAPSAWAMYWEEIGWQARSSLMVRKLAAEMVRSHHRDNERLSQAQRNEMLESEQAGRRSILMHRCVPKISFKRLKPRVNLDGMKPFAHSSMNTRAPQTRFETDRRETFLIYIAYCLGAFRAAVRERSFTDYVLPYLIASITMTVAIWKMFG